ncbi:hypothetical protein [Couchioplanes caeruleus]|uniref:Uncharacterized protein n=1 Tax=Couchioplanes caeruleus subsp. caeruleus TaxID=56427 RepID=A0A1K0FJS4_9ACTN|nr:hypothetical protein [Couchioplanes caeruleus]OJF13119.1 hypothetical protein BG844_16925 [Couchioplanes caeruleus subsp. caeruleus]
MNKLRVPAGSRTIPVGTDVEAALLEDEKAQPGLQCRRGWEAKSDPWAPPSREQVKGGLSEKPELSLSVALDPNSME